MLRGSSSAGLWPRPATPSTGIAELEAAVALAPDIPEVHLALGRAYAQAGRKADADRASATFRKLDSLRRERAATPLKRWRVLGAAGAAVRRLPWSWGF